MSLSIIDMVTVLAGCVRNQITWFEQKELLASSKNCNSIDIVYHDVDSSNKV